MTNEKNVELLALHLEYAIGIHPRGDNESISQWCRRLATWMIETSPHVLVPSALTDDELLACEMDQESRENPVDRAEIVRTVRDRLERFARGEI
jgi:hypothetical protein